MTNRLHTIIPAVLQPTDPAQTAERPHADVTSAEKLSALAAVTLAVLVVGIIAALMGMT
jgi:hypothetical protein